MRDDWKKPLWPWIAALLILLPVLYLLSMWPLLWLFSRDMIPNWSRQVLSVYIIPINYACERAPKPVQEAVTEFVRLFPRKKE
jgi:hypothetical protein